MYYIKKKFEDGSTINMELEDSTIYTRCLFCEKEIEMDLKDLIGEDFEGFDFYSSSTLCSNCSKIFQTFKK